LSLLLKIGSAIGHLIFIFLSFHLIENCSLNKEIANGFLINKQLTQIFNEKQSESKEDSIG
jgi:hypothetical protein